MSDHRPHRFRRAGFTIMEVMIATAVLCMGLMGVLTHYATLQIVRNDTANVAKVQDIIRKLIERTAGADPALMGAKCNDSPPWSLDGNNDPVPYDLGSQPWAIPRFVDPSIPNDRGPMTEGAALPVDDLRAIGLITEPTSLTDLKVYFEYHRGNRGVLGNGVSQRYY